MTKKDFMSYLESRLEILDKGERDDIMAEFSQHIDNKVKAGLTEEEAIKDFGDIEEFVDEILEAYKVNPDFNHKQAHYEYSISRFLRKFGTMINAVSDGICSKNKRELLGMLLKFVILIVLLWLIKIPIDSLCYAVANLFSFMPAAIEQFIQGLIYACVNLAFLIVACYSVYIFIIKSFMTTAEGEEYAIPDLGAAFRNRKNRKERKQEMNNMRDSNSSDSNVDSTVSTPETDLTNAESTVQESSQEPINVVSIVDDDEQVVEERRILDDIKSRKAKPENQAEVKKEDKFFIKLLALCIKIIVICFMIPVVCFGIFTIVAFGVSTVLAVQGLPLVGVTLAILGTLLCTVVFSVWVFRALFNGGDKKCQE